MKEDERDSPRKGRIPLTAEMIAAVRSHAARTGVNPHELLREHLPPGSRIGRGRIYRWMGGEVKTVCPRAYTLALETWTRLPDDVDADQARARMRAEAARTGVGLWKLLSARDNMPEGLSVKRVLNFYERRQDRVAPDHLHYLLKLWAALPSRRFVRLTPEIRAELRSYIDRTGKGPQAMLRGAKDKPEGLKAAVITAWLNGQREARRDQFDYVLRRYEEADDGKPDHG
jgi:hypothetical protein